MRIPRGLPILIAAAGFAVATVPASAQGKKPTKREVAIAACVDEVTKGIGVITTDPMHQRIAAWKACMQRHGQRP